MFFWQIVCILHQNDNQRLRVLFAIENIFLYETIFFFKYSIVIHYNFIKSKKFYKSFESVLNYVLCVGHKLLPLNAPVSCCFRYIQPMDLLHACMCVVCFFFRVHILFSLFSGTWMRVFCLFFSFEHQAVRSNYSLNARLFSLYLLSINTNVPSSFACS